MVPFLSSTMVHQGSEAMSYGLSMEKRSKTQHMDKRPRTMDTLSENLRMLMKATGLTKQELAKKSGVSERMIAYILAKERTATVDVADQLAKPFGISGWQLIIPGIHAELVKAGKLEILVQNYLSSSDKGREYINHVAEKEAEYKAKK